MAAMDILPADGERFDETLATASPDMLREMVARMAQMMMGAEVEQRCGAGCGEVSDALRGRVVALRVVTSGRPTAGDIERYGQYADPYVSSHVITWVELLWKTQGDPEAMLRAGVIDDASSYPECEWGYIVDLDTQVFEVYRGRQAAPHSRGRFATRPHPDGHYPAALVTGWRFDQLPSDEGFLTAL